MNIKLIRVKFHRRVHHHHHHHIGSLSLPFLPAGPISSFFSDFSISFSVPLIPSLDSPQWLQALSSASVAVMANGDLGETILSVRTQRRMGPFR